jgi:hypothetical protein
MKIKIEKLSNTEKQLLELLSEIWDDSDFIVGVLNSLKDDDERKEVIEFIENNDDATSEQIVLLSLDISQSRDNIIVDAFFKDLEEVAKYLKDAE